MRSHGSCAQTWAVYLVPLLTTLAGALKWNQPVLHRPALLMGVGRCKFSLKTYIWHVLTTRGQFFSGEVSGEAALGTSPHLSIGVIFKRKDRGPSGWYRCSPS